jgi:histidine triad (HIT) family protein
MGDVMACTFCAIVEQEDELVFADELTAAFLDIRPLFHGHTLVVPRRHVVTLDQVGEHELTPLFATVQRVMRALRVACDAPGTFVAANNVVSQSVPHLHVHVVPRRPKDGLRGFFWPRTRYDDGDRDAWRDRVREAIAST